MMSPDPDMPQNMKSFIRDLNNMYLAHPAMYQMDDEYNGFEWIQLMKYEENVIAFLRKTEKPEETILAVCNFAAIPYENYQVGVPFAGKYKEIFNSDDKKYGGEGVVNGRVKAAKKAECDERRIFYYSETPCTWRGDLYLHARGRTEREESSRNSD